MVEIEVRQGGSTPTLDELASGRLDVAFVATAGHPIEGLDRRSLSTESMVSVCAPGHRLTSAEWVPLSEPAGESFVDFDPNWGARVISDHAFEVAGIAHPVTIEVNDVHTLLALVGPRTGDVSGSRADHRQARRPRNRSVG